MKKRIIFLLTFTHLTFCFAQNTNAAYFKITPKDHLIEIEADFSSNIQKALLAYDPFLKFSKNKKEFKNAFISYLKTTLVLMDENEKKMDFLNAIEVNNNQQKNRNSFLISYKGSNLKSISNTTLFNISEEQVNYHILKTANKELHFTTTQQQNEYKIPAKFNIFNYKYYVLGALFLIFLIIITIQEYKA